MLLFIVSCSIAIGVSCLCSLAEAVLLSLSPVRLETLRQQGKGYAGGWLKLKKNVDRPIAAILILNTIAHTGGATVAGSAFDSIWGDKYIWVFSILFTFVVLFGTEIAPKVVGVAYNGLLAPVMLKPLQFAIVALKPFIFFTDIVSRWLKPGGAHGGSEVEAADIVTLAQLAKSRSLIDHSQEQIIVNATKLQQSVAGDVMVSADEIVFFQIAHSTDDNLDLARQNLHTRYPVSESDRVADIVGYVNFKEIFAIDPEDRADTLHSYLRHNIDVYKKERLGDVMRRLIAAKRHLAIVRTSDGDIAGMLTLEDVLESIVGDMEEDLDVGPTDLVSAGRGRWTAGGGVTLGGLEQATGRSLKHARDKVIADLVEDRLGRLKKPGDRFEVNGLRFTITQVRRARAHTVFVENLEPDA